jgi:ADP-ribosylation factor-like protein 2
VHLRRQSCELELISLCGGFQVLNLEVMNKDRHWKIVGCSAYSGEGLLQGFDWLVQDIASRIYVLD